MLSIGKLGGDGRSERYYTQSVAKGREDYYAGRGEAPGQWLGSAAGVLYVEGDVSEADLAALLQRRDPKSGATLGRAPSPRSVTGFDLTFSAPKSVSILYAIGDALVSAAARDAHEQAVAEALGYLERSACQTRRGTNGVERVKGKGFVAAAFRHRTTRASDPSLHTHVVVGNVTQTADGRWSTLDSRLLYRHGKTAGYLYQAALRAQLSDRLGVRWLPVVNGVADVVGVPRALIEHFSRRREEIVEHMRERGEHSARAAQVATLQTRRRKDYDVPVDRLREDWRARGAEHGFGRAELTELLDRTERFATHRVEVARRALELAGPQGLTRQASSFTRRDVLQAWAEQHREGARVSRLEELADAWLGCPLATPLDPSGAKGEVRYSTEDMLDVEQRLLASSRERLRTSTATVSREALDAALARRTQLSDEQAGLVERLVSSGDGVQVVRAAAGTGKTFALDAAREAWESDGYRVIGCALSARAAAELQDQAGVEATTIAQLQFDLRHGYRLGERSVLIVDEAGMVGTRALAELADHAETAAAKLVLVGDDRQLPEIDAGGAFRGLAQRLGALELHEVRRQRQAWDVQALAALRKGDVKEWSRAYREHGRIVGGRDAEHTRATLVHDWWQAVHDGPDRESLIVAHRRSDVSDLNQRARARMRDNGRLGPDELTAAGRAFAAGDRIITRHNDRALDLANGLRGIVLDVEADAHTLQVKLDSGRDVQLPSRYLDDGHLDHAYALTAHKVQGHTADRVFVLGSDDLYREWGYTALSRHRDEARFYINLGDPQLELPGLQTHQDDPLQAQLKQTLARSRAQQLAKDLANRSARPAKDRQQPSAVDLVQMLRTMPTDGGTPDREADGDRITKELADAERRLRESEHERHRVGVMQRRRRAELDRLMTLQQRNIDRLRTEQLEFTRSPDTPGAHDAVLERAVRTPISARGSRRHTSLARLIARDKPERVMDGIGPRPASLTLRDDWDRRALAVLESADRAAERAGHPAIATHDYRETAIRPVDHDVDLDRD